MSSFWLILKQQWTIKISSPLFPIFSLAAILVGNRDHRTQVWKGAIQGPFHQSLVQIGPVASEELIKKWKFNGRTTDIGRSVVTIWVRWAKKKRIRHLTGDSAKHEVNQYLMEPCIEDNPLGFWGSNENNYPILASMAKRFLAIPASSAPVERL